MQEGKSAVEWPADLALAKDVIVAHADIASAGLRASMLVCRTLRTLTKVSSTKSSAKLFDYDEEGDRKEASPAWTDNTGPAGLGVEVETFMDSDSKPVLTLIIINAPLSLENTSTIALEVASKLIKSQVSNVTLLAAVRFSPKTTANASLVHTIGFKSGAVQALSKHEKLCEWDPAWPIEDGFLAAMLQLLRLEQSITTEALLALGHRLPRAVQLNLPGSDAQDPSLPTVLQLVEAVQLGIASAPLKAAAQSQPLPACDAPGLKGRFQPARPLTEGEFAAPDPDSASSLYK
mmetsp:Transcript_42633/g.100143  ORF Transcript_42633/g.100143 Transcript_42633/m.100143 type:complete len:291 (-) Transcript_42633:23-895(-)